MRNSLTFARRWLYDRQLLVMRERDLRTIIVAAIRQYEATPSRMIQAMSRRLRWHGGSRGKNGDTTELDA
jgi:hypothetical protein